MLTTRTVAAGAATFVVLMLAGEPVRADSVKQTKASPPAEAAIAKATRANARPCRRAAGKRDTARAKREAARLKKRAAERKRRQRIAKSDVPTPERSDVPEARPGNAADIRPDPSIAERRFREFINPRLVAENPIEALRKSWPESTQLTGESSYPPAGLMAQAKPQMKADDRQATEIGAGAESSVASGEIVPARGADAGVRTEVKPIDRSTDAVAVAPREQATELRRTTPSDGRSDQSWLPVIFILWGGVLTLGSALRLLIG
jgi:hypothetical protein